MAKTPEGAAQKSPALHPQPNRLAITAPVPAPKPPERVLSVRHLDVHRHGNDDYSVTEVVLEGPLAGPMRVVSTKRIGNERMTANVTRDWVRDWYTRFVGDNFTGPYWR